MTKKAMLEDFLFWLTICISTHWIFGNILRDPLKFFIHVAVVWTVWRAKGFVVKRLDKRGD